MRRLLFIMAVALVPMGALADASATSDASTSASSLQNTGSTTASPQTSGLLQPAQNSVSPLQSADATGGGVSQSTVENLQQSGTSDQAKLLIEGDGDAPHQLSSAPDLTWLLYILLVLVAASAGTTLARFLPRRAS